MFEQKEADDRPTSSRCTDFASIEAYPDLTLSRG